MLEDERQTHKTVIDELRQKIPVPEFRKSFPWGRRIKSIPKAPAPPKNVVRIAELEEQISEFSEMLAFMVEDKRQLVEMNTQLLGQIRTFLRDPPAQFLEFHINEQVEKNKSLTSDLALQKSQNDAYQKKIAEQQRKIKDLEKILYRQSKKSSNVPKQEETDQTENQEHVIDSQTNALLSQLKELQANAHSLGVTTKTKPLTKLITTERKLLQQLDLMKQKLSESKSRELDLELDLIVTKEELQKYKLAMDVANMINT